MLSHVSYSPSKVWVPDQTQKVLGQGPKRESRVVGGDGTWDRAKKCNTLLVVEL